MSIATYYTLSRQRCADGSRFNPRAMTCASRVYPLHTRLLVSRGGRKIVLTVTDRTAQGRCNLDLTPAAMAHLCPDYKTVGVLRVRIRVLSPPKHHHSFSSAFHKR